MWQKFSTSWRTSLGGLAGIGFGAYLISIGEMAGGMAAISNGIANLFARDQVVTSKQAGAE